MTFGAIVVVIIVLVVVAVLVLARTRSHQRRDGVDSFRRQIDALSPEARRPVIDQVQNAAGRIDPRADDEDDAADDDEDGARGT